MKQTTQKTQASNASQPLKNSKHENFAQLVADGEFECDAYKKVYGAKPSVARANGTRLLTNASVRARVDWLKEQNAEAKALSREEKRQILAEIARSAESRICTKDGDVYSNPDYQARIRAIQEDNRMTGDIPDSEKKEPVTVVIQVPKA